MRATSTLLTGIALVVTGATFLPAPTYAALDEAAYAGHIMSVHEQHEKELREYLLAETAQYRTAFPAGAHLTDVLYVQGKTHLEGRDEHQALASYLGSLILGTGGEYRAACADEARRIARAEKPWKDAPDSLLARIDQTVTGSAADRHHAYLDAIVWLKSKKLHERTLRDCRAFIARYPDDARVPMVQRWIGDVYLRKGDYEAAVSAYDAVEKLFPNARELPHLWYNKGILLAAELDRAKEAEALFTQVLETYGDSGYARRALRARGDIRIRELGQFDAGIQDLWLMVERYPDHPDTRAVLIEIAESEEKEKRYGKAVEAYLTIPDRFPEPADPAVEAMQTAAELAEKRLDDQERAARILLDIATRYPDHPEAVEALFDAADEYKSLGRNADAIAALQRIIEAHPQTKHSQDATKEIAKLQGK